MIEVRVNRKAADRVASGHPWIFSSDVVSAEGASSGIAVKVVDPRGRALGVAHYSSSSQISLRLLSGSVKEIDRSFFLERIAAAARYRESVVRDTDAYRLVHAEGDLLPALIVDRYADYVVMQTLDQGMDQERDVIASCLTELLSPKAIIARNDAPVRTHEPLARETSVLSGEVPAAVAVRMNRITFHANLVGGQKTGIYLDQRENYLAAARYAHGHALDCFTSSGGFALPMSAKCESVEAADSSAAALAFAGKNRQANNPANVEFRQADAFELLAGYAAQRRKFLTLVLGPPAFAKSRKNFEGAIPG